MNFFNLMGDYIYIRLGIWDQVCRKTMDDIVIKS
jgi:hypothetical protein